MHRRALAAALTLSLLPAISLSTRGDVASAEASVSYLVSIDELVHASEFVVIATPIERTTSWEEIGGSRRIVTYTRLSVEKPVTGAPGNEVWVRTLGGAVGKVGQTVSGEAQLTKGKRALVFLAKVNGILVVTGRAQGHYLVREDDKLAPSPDAGELLPRRGPTISAREALVGARLDDAVKTVVRARARNGAK